MPIDSDCSAVTVVHSTAYAQWPEAFEATALGRRLPMDGRKTMLGALMLGYALRALLAARGDLPRSLLLIDPPRELMADDGRWLRLDLPELPRLPEIRIVETQVPSTPSERRSALHEYVKQLPACRVRHCPVTPGHVDASLLDAFDHAACVIVFPSPWLATPLTAEARSALAALAQRGALQFMSKTTQISEIDYQLDRHGFDITHAVLPLPVTIMGRLFVSLAQASALGPARGDWLPEYRSLLAEKGLSFPILDLETGQIQGVQVTDEHYVSPDGEMRQLDTHAPVADFAPLHLAPEHACASALGRAHAYYLTHLARVINTVCLPDGRTVKAPALSFDAPLPRLFEAFQRGPSALQSWVRAGGCLNETDRAGRTVLHYAIGLRSSASAVTVLLALGVDPDLCDQHGWPALAYAVALDAVRIRDVLLDAGADTTRPLPDGTTIDALLDASGYTRDDDAPSPAIAEPPPAMLSSRAPVARLERLPAHPMAAAVKHSIAGAPPVVAEQRPAPARAEPPPPAPGPETLPVFVWAVQFPASVTLSHITGVLAAWLPTARRPDVDAALPNLTTPDFAVASDTDAAAGIWALRFDNTRAADMTYRTEVVIVQTPAATHLSLKLTALRPASSDAELVLSTPRVIEDLARLGATDAGLPLGRALTARTEQDGRRLADLIQSPDRALPVLMLTPRGTQYFEDLSERVLASMHVIRAEREALDYLRTALGRHYVTWGGAWRIYRPGFRTSDDMHSSPILFGQDMSPALRLSILQRTLARFAKHDGVEELAPSYLTARRAIASRRQAAKVAADAALAAIIAPTPPIDLAPPCAPTDTPALIEPVTAAAAPVEVAPAETLPDPLLRRVRDLEADLHAARADLAVWEEVANEADQRASGLAEERDQLRAQLYAANQRINALLASASPVDESPAEAYPSHLNGLADWVEQVAPDRLHITPKAWRIARETHLEPDVVEQAYGGLEALATDYLDAKLGNKTAYARFESRLKDLRLDCGPVGIAATHRMYSDAYHCHVDGKRYRCDMHLQGSSTTDPKRCLRIYFYCDLEQHRIIVGHLPTHLDSTLS